MTEEQLENSVLNESIKLNNVLNELVNNIVDKESIKLLKEIIRINKKLVTHVVKARACIHAIGARLETLDNDKTSEHIKPKIEEAQTSVKSIGKKLIGN